MDLPAEVLSDIAGYVGPGFDRRSVVRSSCQLQQTCTALHDVCAEDVYKAKEQWGYFSDDFRKLAILEDHYRTCRWIVGMPWPRYNKKYSLIKK